MDSIYRVLKLVKMENSQIKLVAATKWGLNREEATDFIDRLEPILPVHSILAMERMDPPKTKEDWISLLNQGNDNNTTVELLPTEGVPPKYVLSYINVFAKEC